MGLVDSASPPLIRYKLRTKRVASTFDKALVGPICLYDHHHRRPRRGRKSSAARALAERIGFRFLDTGAMYRAVALAAMRRNIPWEDAQRLADLVGEIEIQVSESQVLLDGEDVTKEIRKMEVTSVIHHVADHPKVRSQLVDLQRSIAAGGDFVTEGRDQGTVAFANAECKIFLTASPEERVQADARPARSRRETRL